MRDGSVSLGGSSVRGEAPRQRIGFCRCRAGGVRGGGRRTAAARAPRSSASIPPLPRSRMAARPPPSLPPPSLPPPSLPPSLLGPRPLSPPVSAAPAPAGLASPARKGALRRRPARQRLPPREAGRRATGVGGQGQGPRTAAVALFPEGEAHPLAAGARPVALRGGGGRAGGRVLSGGEAGQGRSRAGFGAASVSCGARASRAAPPPRPQLRDVCSSGARIREPAADPTPRRYPLSPVRIRSMSRSSSPPPDPRPPPSPSPLPQSLPPPAPPLRLRRPWVSAPHACQTKRSDGREKGAQEHRGEGKRGRGRPHTARRLRGGARARRRRGRPPRTPPASRSTPAAAAPRGFVRQGPHPSSFTRVITFRLLAAGAKAVHPGRGGRVSGCAPIAPGPPCRGTAPPPRPAAARASAPSSASSPRRRPPRPPAAAGGAGVSASQQGGGGGAGQPAGGSRGEGL